MPSPSPLTPLRRAIAREVRSIFNDRTRGERPVERREDGLFPPGSPVRLVHVARPALEQAVSPRATASPAATLRWSFMVASLPCLWWYVDPSSTLSLLE